MRTDALVEFGSIGLDPAKESGVVDLHTAISQHALEITMADRELQVPADRPQDDLRRELPTFERVLVILLHYQPLSTPSGRSSSRTSFKAATEPAILGGVEMVHMMRKGQAKYARNPQPSLAEQFEVLAA
jgi:hypothetical protein